jgi:hypothetical protein
MTRRLMHRCKLPSTYLLVPWDRADRFATAP